MARFFLRLGGALALLPYVYEDVEQDESSLPQAFAVVTLASLATGAAYFPQFGWTGLLAGTVAAVLAWLGWSWLAFHIGVRYLPEPNTEADWGQLLRTTGFATAPGILRLIAIIPEAHSPVFILTWLWMLVAFVLAVRQALDYQSTARAVAVCLAGAVIYLAALFLLPAACPLQA